MTSRKAPWSDLSPGMVAGQRAGQEKARKSSRDQTPVDASSDADHTPVDATSDRATRQQSAVTNG